MDKNIPQEIERFDLSARIQHIIMFTTFLILSFTGWGLKYAYVEPSSTWINIWGGPRMAGIIHRVAGITMLLDFIYHQFYLLNLARKRDLRLTIIPMPKDVVDMVHQFLSNFGLRKERPYFGKFTFLQKFDTIVDRLHDMIVSGGFNVYPREVENALSSHGAVLEAAVVGRSDPDWGETVHAAVVLRPGRHASAGDLMRHCAGILPGYKKPRSIEIVAGLPKNPSGKVLRREIRARLTR